VTEIILRTQHIYSTRDVFRVPRSKGTGTLSVEDKEDTTNKHIYPLGLLILRDCTNYYTGGNESTTTSLIKICTSTVLKILHLFCVTLLSYKLLHIKVLWAGRQGLQEDDDQILRTVLILMQFPSVSINRNKTDTK
ncbi:hypothetical protein ACJX0J_035923, partial [Zea mays]